MDVKQRYKLLERFDKDPSLIKYEISKCRIDKKHFINQWCLTFDPRRPPKHFPFNLYEFQNESIDWITDKFKKKENGLIEKSRDMGVSWLVTAWSVHEWIFGRGISILFGSRKEELVDNFTIDSIFGKLRYLVEGLPIFLRPEYTVKHMAMMNKNGNQITGESANIGFGRGGRSSICFLDEFAHVPHSEAVWSSVSENSDCIISLSTPNGKSNQFSWLRHETKISTLSLHWSRHPLKTQEWYDKRKLQMRPHQVAQELDLSYERSVEGRVYQRFDRKWHVAKENILCNPDFEQFVAWDFGIADPTAILFGQITDIGIIQIWGCFELTDQDIDFFAPITKGYKPKSFQICDTETKTNILKLHKKVPVNHDASHYGDHSGTARTANSNRSCKAALKENGIQLQTSGKQTFDWRMECVDAILKLRHNHHERNEWYSIFEVSPDCERFIDCMFNYRWESEDKINDDKLKPKHDWASHMVTAFEFFAINRFPIRKSTGVREEQIR